MTDVPPPLDPNDPLVIEAARRRVQLPAVFLGIAAGLSVLGAIAGLVQLAFVGADARLDPFRQMIQDEDQVRVVRGLLEGPIPWIFGSVPIVIGLVVLVGAWKMFRLEAYTFALTSAVLSVVPCFWLSNCCCCFTLPVGIWALVVLLDTKVQAAFR